MTGTGASPLTRTLWCLDCGQQLTANVAQSQRESGALPAICTSCLHLRKQQATKAAAYQAERLKAERERAEQFAKTISAEQQTRRYFEELEGYVPEGGPIPWL